MTQIVTVGSVALGKRAGTLSNQLELPAINYTCTGHSRHVLKKGKGLPWIREGPHPDDVMGGSPGPTLALPRWVGGQVQEQPPTHRL